MAIAIQTKVAPFGAITIHRAISAMTEMRIALAAWRETRATRIALHSLSDEILNDIGVTRWDIENTLR
jgi:uncharacterized protein YjiS (DUF1127 family)